MTSRRDRSVEALLIAAHEAERTRIARELHDDISQRMAVLTMDLDLLEKGLAAGSPDASARVRALSEQSLTSLEERLDPSTFTRVHRKCIVRFYAVRSVGVGKNPRIELVTGLSVPLARSRRREIMDRLRA